ncbi:hypothetical protein ACJX0J_034375, partial [Zea mays]
VKPWFIQTAHKYMGWLLYMNMFRVQQLCLVQYPLVLFLHVWINNITSCLNIVMLVNNIGLVINYDVFSHFYTKNIIYMCIWILVCAHIHGKHVFCCIFPWNIMYHIMKMLKCLGIPSK